MWASKSIMVMASDGLLPKKLAIVDKRFGTPIVILSIIWLVSTIAVLADLPVEAALFSESLGRFLVTTSAEDADAFETSFQELACRRVGVVTGEQQLTVELHGKTVVDLSVASQVQAFKETLGDE